MNKSYSKIRHIQETNLKLEGRLINEQSNYSTEIEEALGGGTTNARPDRKIDSLEEKTIELGSKLFKLGSDKIDTNSQEFKKAVDIIRQSGAGNITLQGGASSVGGAKYNNQALANRRAENFKRALVDSGLTGSRINIIPGIVTPNTDTPNSPEANKAQFVRFTMTNLERKFGTEFAIDNTALAKKVIPIKQIKVEPEEKSDLTYIDVRITFARNTLSKTILDLIKVALKNIRGVKVERIK